MHMDGRQALLHPQFAPLEAGVLGFDYGYSVALSADALHVWRPSSATLPTARRC
jgi:hypothetical protein